MAANIQSLVCFIIFFLLKRCKGKHFPDNSKEKRPKKSPAEAIGRAFMLNI